MRTGNIFIITAPSGAGKTTLVSALLAADANVQLSVSYTTRAAREGEVEGKHYHFVSRDAFEAKLAHGDFLEYAEVYGNYYGTSAAWISQAVESGQDILLEIDWQGAAQVRKVFPQAIGVFILPPSVEVLKDRLYGRGKDDAASIERRMASAREEISHVDEFDYVIINEHIDEAIRDLLGLVRAERLRQPKQALRFANLISHLKGL